MRLFVAVDVPRVVVPGLLPGSAEAPSHVTVRFLGEVEGDRVPDITKALEHSLAGARGGWATLEGMGGFPNRERPRVLWIGIGQGSAIFMGIYERVEAALVSLGFPREERPFQPHVTLARLKDRDRQEEARRAIRECEGRAFATFEVTDVRLKQSILSHSGVEHTTLVSIPLGPPSS